MASANIFEMNQFLTDKLNLPRKLFASDEEIRQFLRQMVEQQSLGQLPAPSPSTAAGKVEFPSAPNVTI